jgi:hypothetical protein
MSESHAVAKQGLVDNRTMVALTLAAQTEVSDHRMGGLTIVRTGLARHGRGLTAIVVLAALAIVTPASVAAATSNSSPRGAFEIDVSNTNGYFAYRSGEPEIVVNPTNPNDIAMVYAQTMLTYANHNFTFSGGTPSALFTAPAFIACGVATSTNGGRSWVQAGQPFPTISLDATDCGDPTLAVTPNGTLYLASDVLQPPFTKPATNGIGFVMSTDWGKSWSTRVFTGNPVDRPWLKLDASTGALYQASGLFGTNAGRQVVASHDAGATWGPPHVLATPGLPGGDDGTIDAALGVLAAAYVDTAAIPPQVVFETSTSDGASWTPHLVPLADGVGSGAFRPVAEPSPWPS